MRAAQYAACVHCCARGLRCLSAGQDLAWLQVEFIEDMFAFLGGRYAATSSHADLRRRWPKPSFKVVVLYVDEATSVRRQLARQAKSAAHNAKVLDARAGTLMCAPVCGTACRKLRDMFCERQRKAQACSREREAHTSLAP